MTAAPATTSVSDRTVWDRLGRPLRALVWLLAILALTELLRAAGDLVAHLVSVALLFLFASVLTVLLTPAVDRLQRLRLLRGRRGPAVALLSLGILVALAGTVAALLPSIIDQGKALPVLKSRVQDGIDSLQRLLADHGIAVDLHSAGGSGVIGSPVGLVTGTLTVVVDVALVVVITIYLLGQGRELVASLRNLAPGHAHLFDFTLVAFGATIGSYARGQLLMSTLMGVYTGVSLTALGIHYALLLAILAAVLELLPLVGATISMAAIVLIALLQSPGLAVAALVVGLGGHAIDAYIVGPRVNARAVQLHPLAAIAALLVGAEVAGILGALLAVPAAAVANIFLGAFYRSRRGDTALSTDSDGRIHADTLPRLGEEISEIEDQDGPIDSDPVPHTTGLPRAPRPGAVAGSAAAGG